MPIRAAIQCLLVLWLLALPVRAQDYTDPILRTGLENSTCQNGTREDYEQCDDGNATVGDGCAANCRLINCGDSQLDGPFEECDDGDADSNDGCDGRFCFIESGWSCAGSPSVCASDCGDGLVRGAEQCDDHNTNPMDGCSETCQVEVGYQCLGEPSVCALTCGDGVIQSGEQCDDANFRSDDGCSGTCQIEMGFTCTGTPSVCSILESEPNEDGSLSTGGTGVLGNDFGPPTITNALNGGLFTTATDAHILRRFKLNPVGDEDVFVVYNDDSAARSVRADIWLAGPGFGVGVPCGGAIDTGLNLRRASDPFDDGLKAPSEASNDDRNGGADRCSGLSFNIGPNETLFLHVVEYGDNATITDDLLLELSSERLPCGNGVIETGQGEQCDDGNFDNLDGCSSACIIEANFLCRQEPSLCYLVGGEPNDDGVPNTGGAASGNDFGPPTIANVDANSGPAMALELGRVSRRAGTISPAGDEDVYAIRNDFSADQLVRIETWMDATGQGEGQACTTLDANQINLRVDGGGGGLAPGIYQSSRARSATTGDRCAIANVIMAPNTTLYAQLLQANDAGTFGPYLLTVRHQENHCADGAVVGLEECDDGGSGNGDGCSSVCLQETGFQCAGQPSACVNCSTRGEQEPNDVPITATTTLQPPDVTCNASLSPTGDIDFYRLQVPARASLRLQTNDPELVGNCAGSERDTEIQLYAPDGTTLLAADDDDGPGACSLLEAPTDSALVGLQPGTYFVRVNEHGNNAPIAAYRLQASVVSLCGNGVPESTETCDDGNLGNADGCNNQCEIEFGYQCDGTPSLCGVSEPEPNEDGSVSTGGANFVGNDAGSPSVANSSTSLGTKLLSVPTHTINGNLYPAGDEDIVTIQNDTAQARNVTVEIWRNHPGYGVGVACGNSFDTLLRAADVAAGGLAATTLAQNDDRGTGDRCSRLIFPLLAGQTRYVQLMEFQDDQALPGYRMVITSTPPTCGDFLIEAGEQCDDGNVANTDFCSSTCQLQNTSAEVEPNASTANVLSTNNFVLADYLLSGAISPVADNDFVGLRVAAPNSVVRLETQSVISGCDSRTTSVTLYDQAGTSLLSDTVSGMGNCSAITVPLPDTNNYFFRVGESGDDATLANYLLEAQYYTNTASESEPNESLATANTNLMSPNNHLAVPGDHSIETDQDWYMISVPPNAAVRAEIVEANRSVETCESNSIDSRLTLFNSAGAMLISDDDDGRGFCSKLDGKDGDTAARNTSGTTQTWYLRVDASPSANTAAKQFQYQLVYSIR